MSLNAKKGTLLTYVKAGSPQGLRRLITRIEAIDGYFYDWDIHKDGKTWIAFYRKQIANAQKEIEEMGAE